MYSIGDKVVYPMHGAGIITAIEAKEILGAIQKYYVLELPIGEMQVLVPVQNEHANLRYVLSAEEMEEMEVLFLEELIPESSNWNHRYRANMDKLKTGSFQETISVLAILDRRAKEKTLSSGERRMIDTAKRIAVSEIMLVCDYEEIIAEDWIKDKIGCAI